MNSFYNLPKWLQWVIAILMTFLATVIMGVFFNWTKLHPLAWLSFLLIIPIFQFLTSPIITLTKGYQYLSPMLLVFSASEKKYDIHNGTSFDYLMVMRKVKPGVQWRKKMLSYYIEGLLKIIDKIEKGELPNTVEVRGSSYFFSDRTAKRMGFKLQKTGVFEKINLILNLIDLTWTYSLSHGKFSIPNVFKIQTATITGQDLVKTKSRVENLYLYLKSK